MCRMGSDPCVIVICVITQGSSWVYSESRKEISFVRPNLCMHLPAFYYKCVLVLGRVVRNMMPGFLCSDESVPLSVPCCLM